MNEFRAILRSKTSAAHATLDAALVKYDLTSQDGLTAYLSVHHAARIQLGQISPEHGDIINNAHKLEELEDDLAVLGAVPPQIEIKNNTDIHPLGLTYVIAGSSLGGKMLYKEWLQSGDNLVRRAGKFLTSSKDSTEWTAFLRDTQSLELPRDELDDVVASANTVFAIFEAANEKIRQAHND